jgi:hypothetical protein
LLVELQFKDIVEEIACEGSLTIHGGLNDRVARRIRSTIPSSPFLSTDGTAISLDKDDNNLKDNKKKQREAADHHVNFVRENGFVDRIGWLVLAKFSEPEDSHYTP